MSSGCAEWPELLDCMYCALGASVLVMFAAGFDGSEDAAVALLEGSMTDGGRVEGICL